jgi:aminoglycoside phosphotransferase
MADQPLSPGRDGRGKIGGEEYGDRVIKVSQQIAVKYGYGVTASEAATQDFAYRRVDHRVVHIPRVFRLIESNESSDPKGYLFMEYVPGRSLIDVDLEAYPDIVPRMANIVLHLSQIQGDKRSGPFGGGKPQGYTWGDYGANTEFYSIGELNTYMNKRLEIRNDSIDLTPYPLVLCHLDLCRRNMILNDDFSLCLVDWGFAGLYPRFFEIAMVPCVVPYDAPFEPLFMQELENVMDFTDAERQLIKLIRCVRAANVRWTL